MQHVLVNYEPGFCSFGPANSGIWNWGDEIVVGFTTGPYDPNRGKPPLTDQTKPAFRRQARSLDGGRTWALEELPDGTVVGVVEDVSFLRITPFADVWLPIGTIHNPAYRTAFRGNFMAAVLAPTRKKRMKRPSILAR